MKLKTEYYKAADESPRQPGEQLQRTIEGIVEQLTVHQGWKLTKGETFTYTYSFVDKEFFMNGTWWFFGKIWLVNYYGMIPKEAIDVVQSFHLGDRIQMTVMETETTITIVSAVAILA